MAYHKHIDPEIWESDIPRLKNVLNGLIRNPATPPQDRTVCRKLLRKINWELGKCPDCSGNGYIQVSWNPDTEDEECSTCHGSGRMRGRRKKPTEA